MLLSVFLNENFNDIKTNNSIKKTILQNIIGKYGYLRIHKLEPSLLDVLAYILLVYFYPIVVMINVVNKIKNNIRMAKI